MQKMKKIIFCILFAPIASFAAAPKPESVYSPIPGGYVLRQKPGPNLSTKPTEVSPSAGRMRANAGAFAGGVVFRSSGSAGAKVFEVGGKYDAFDISDVIPKPPNFPASVPKPPVKVALDVITEIPRPSAVKAIAKSLPLIGTVIAVVDFANDLAQAWDAADPAGKNANGPAIYTPQDGVHRLAKNKCWRSGDGTCYGNIASYCAIAYAGYNLLPLQVSPTIGRCTSQTGVYTGFPVELQEIVFPTPIPETMVEQVAPTLSPQKVEQAFDALKDSPHFSPELTDSESASNTRVLPSASATPSTTTTTSPNSITTTTTSPAQSTTTTTTTNADNSTTTTTSVTNITYNNNIINTTTNTTTINKDKDGNPLPDTPTDPETPPTDPETPPPDPDKPPEDPPPDLCEKNPDILACKKLEQPDPEEIPKENRQIELVSGPTFSGGSCIPDVMANVNGQSIKILETSTPCGWITDYFKPLILLLASISAVFIVMPRDS